jgi:general secretion pathway protein A
MYSDYFGFSEPPFSLTPNPEFLFLSSRHQEAFAHLLYGIDNRVGFIELSGEVGAGKTTVIRTLLAQLDPETHRSALIFNPTVSPTGLLQEVNREFGLPCASTDTTELLQALNSFLVEENRTGRAVVLVIDEAQNLSPEVLEQVRLISNLETDRAKLIQIVLVGQPELKALLARQELRQLHQRITVRYHLEPMDFDDTVDYIRHRIRIAAGGSEPLAFAPAAVKRIYRFSGGLPRLINAACDRGVLLAYTRETREVTAAMASAAVADVRKEERKPLLRRPAAALVLLLAVTALGFSVVAATRHGAPKREQAAETLPLGREAAFASLAAAPEGATAIAAANALFREWKVASAAPGTPADVRELAKDRGLTATVIDADLASLARIDAPALLRIELPGGSTRLLALTAARSGRYSVIPAVAGRTELTGKELASIWSGHATILWKNFYAIPQRLRPGIRDRRVKPLQELLKGAAVYRGAATGTFDVTTVEAIRAFQRAEGMTPDGRPGDRTLLLLYRRAGGFFPPGLLRDPERGTKHGNDQPGTAPDAERTR